MEKDINSSSALRARFLDYFAKQGHAVVPSSPLVPVDDPTLLFTNAGMVQFKELFLGSRTAEYTKAASSQRCVRAGGKHNDLENVGYTARHHTFFEMLGNFSFGDYFKEEAIRYAWQFLTQELGLPPEKLWITVFREDDEAAKIWIDKIGIDPKRFSRCDESDNFWSMGDTGPCGPCTEIFYDHGPKIAGGPPGTAEQDGDRYVEIWNLVFMQYNRDADGKLEPLPKPSVDTGMGLERLAAVMQGVHNNYDTDIFRRLIKGVAETIGCENGQQPSLRVIADHIRSIAFLMTDAVMPSNEGRGYVLRRIIRRAARHGDQLGATEPFLYRLVVALVDEMGDAYPELAQAQSRVEEALKREEKLFAETLSQGLRVYKEEVSKLSSSRQFQEIPGEVVFKLYDTYGFPPDLTADMAREENLTIDEAGFEKAMQVQRARSKEGSQFKSVQAAKIQTDHQTQFTGYEKTQDTGNILALFKDASAVTSLSKAEIGVVILDQTPFYAEAGGQVGDKGIIKQGDTIFTVHDTRRSSKAYLHYGEVTVGGELTPDKPVEAIVDPARLAIMRNHTATHLLHSALRRVIGEQVMQKGSLVAADRLRFDFTCPQALTREQIKAVERLVNQKIYADLGSVTTEEDIDAVKAKGDVLALFGEKYEQRVRVLRISDFSAELCGGTHVERTGQIGLFKITAETGVAAGIRRIEAVTGEEALDCVDHLNETLEAAAALLKTKSDILINKLEQLIDEKKVLKRQMAQLEAKAAGGKSQDLLAQAVSIGDLKVLAIQLDAANPKLMREMVDQFKQKLKTSVIVLATVANDKVLLSAGATKDCTDRIHAGELLAHVADQVGGKAGGRPDMAQGGGSDVDNLTAALDSVLPWVQEKLGN